MFSTKILKLTIFLFFSLIFLNSCGGKLPGADARKYPADPKKRIEQNIKDGKSFRLFDSVGNARGGTFDFAIHGEGFFQIQMPNGEIGYTRDGAWQKSDTGTLVNHRGFPVQPGIVIPPNTSELTVSSDGNVQAKIAGTDEPVIVGQIQVARFPNPGGLRAIGDNLFLATEASGATAISTPGLNGAGSLAQGFVESSNVNAIEEVAALIRAERAYSMNSKVMSTADQMMASRR